MVEIMSKRQGVVEVDAGDHLPVREWQVCRMDAAEVPRC